MYKSTDPTFNQIKTITDAFGNPLLFKPLAIFDLKNGLRGVHPVRIGSEIGPESDLGISYNMGNDSGVKHYFIDNDVHNGRTYYYAVVSIDRGYHPSFYPALSDRESLLTISPTECSAIIQTDLLGRAISTDVNTAIVVPTEPPAGWQTPQLGAAGIERVSGNGTGKISVEVFDPNRVQPNRQYRLACFDDSSYTRYSARYTGRTSHVTLQDEQSGVALASLADPDSNVHGDEFVADGIRLIVKNDSVSVDTMFWSSGSPTLRLFDRTVENNSIRIPRDYEIRVLPFGSDTSVNAQPTNFQVWDVTNAQSPFRVRYRYTNLVGEPAELRGVLSENDRILLVSDFSTTTRLWIFEFGFPQGLDSLQRLRPADGNILKISTTKSFDRDDVFRFAMTGNDISGKKAKDDLGNIYTVPDPYMGSSSLERKVINEAEGRGDRRLDFVNLPHRCTITIFTTSGRLVRVLSHESRTNLSRAPWDLRTKDGLEVSAGIYFYVVDAPGIGSKTGRLAIIK